MWCRAGRLQHFPSILTFLATDATLSSMLTPSQCRAARALLDWTQEDLARTAGVGGSTVRGFECGRHVLIRSNMAVIRAALEAAGIVFIDGDGMGPGVRLRHANGHDVDRPAGRTAGWGTRAPARAR